MVRGACGITCGIGAGSSAGPSRRFSKRSCLGVLRFGDVRASAAKVVGVFIPKTPWLAQRERSLPTSAHGQAMPGPDAVTTGGDLVRPRADSRASAKVRPCLGPFLNAGGARPVRPFSSALVAQGAQADIDRPTGVR